MKLSKIYKLFIVLSGVIFFSCDSDNPEIPHEEELITTVKLTLHNESDENTEDLVFIYSDHDGDGGEAAEITVPKLAAGTVYHGHIEFLNESEEHEQGSVASPKSEVEDDHEHGDDITEEIKDEAEEHQIFYLLDPSTLATIDYAEDDVDGNGNPIGLEVAIETDTAGSGKLRIVLLHEPKKPNSGTLADAGGSTDLDVTFDFVVE